MREHKDQFGVEPVLREIGIKPSTFHDWRMREVHPSARTVRDRHLAARIRELHEDSKGVYGSPPPASTPCCAARASASRANGSSG